MTKPERLIAAAFRECRRDIRLGGNAMAAVMRLQISVASALPAADPAAFHRACKGDES